MNISLSAWIELRLRQPSSYNEFALYDAIQHANVSSGVEDMLVHLLKLSRIDPKLLNAILRKGPAAEEELIKTGLPSVPTAESGDFGEVLTSAALVEFLGYSVPVPKLRFGINPNQGMPSTDLIAIKGAGDSISEVCFVESKTRTARDNDAAAEGYDQLVRDYTQKLPQMIFFVLNRLAERNDSLFDAFLNYAFDRRNTVEAERFHLGLTWDASVWSETVLKKLEAIVDNSTYPKLSVHLLTIKDLRNFILQLFARMGITLVI